MMHKAMYVYDSFVEVRKSNRTWSLSFLGKNNCLWYKTGTNFNFYRLDVDG